MTVPTMTKVIRPLVVTDTMLTSASVPETDYAEWAVGTTYALGGRCIRASTHRIYESLIAGNIGVDPATDTSATPKWLDIGPTNRWAMFDDVIGTATTATSSLSVTLSPISVGAVSLLELQGRTLAVTLKDHAGGSVVYSRTITLDGSFIESFYDWFFADYVQLTDVVLTDLPPHFQVAELTITLTASGANPVACGVCKFGDLIEIGATRYGAGVEINDYSRKETDDFGRTTIVKRAFSKRVTLPIVTNKGDFNRIYRQLAALRATPCVYIATEAPGYEPLIVYGFFKGFGISVEYQQVHQCDLNIEGLI